jgi:hypothetical protein
MFRFGYNPAGPSSRAASPYTCTWPEGEEWLKVKREAIAVFMVLKNNQQSQVCRDHQVIKQEGDKAKAQICESSIHFYPLSMPSCRSCYGCPTWERSA